MVGTAWGCPGHFTSVGITLGNHRRVSNRKGYDNKRTENMFLTDSLWLGVTGSYSSTLINDAGMNVFGHKSWFL